MASFSTSDIIALVAVIVSGITSVTTVVFGYYTNKSSNRAKLSEIAFEKRLEAFRNVFEAISIANNKIQRYVLFRSIFPSKQDMVTGKESGKGMYSKDDFISIDNEFVRCKSEFETAYHANRIYLPPEIDRRIQLYIKEVLYEQVQLEDFNLFANELGKRVDVIDHLKKVVPLKEKYTADIVSEMQKFIGF